MNYMHRPHILVVDDDRRIRDLVSRYLEDHGFVVLTAEDAAEAGDVLDRFECDAMVLDVMMPGESGVEFSARIREQGGDIPILLLTALGEGGDRIAGLESGADDYLVKPFEPRELLLRLNSILKRSLKAGPIEELRVRIGPWIFDVQGQQLQSDDTVLSLTSAEVVLLSALCEKPGEVLGRDELTRVCGLEAGERTIDVQVTRLRRKIEQDTKNPRYLQTVRGKGYRLRAEIV